MTGLAFPKYRRLTLREERAEKRRAVKANTERVRREMRARDGYKCRVPGCRERGDMAHIKPKGMGGDHQIRTTTANVMSCCPAHHKESIESIHAGTLVITPLTEAGADGPLKFRFKVSRMTITEPR